MSTRLAVAVLVIGLLLGCAVADNGFSVEVRNECAEEIGFVIDGGSPPANPREVRSRLPAGTSEKYSVIAGSTGGYFWLREPQVAEPFLFSGPSDGVDTIVVRVAGAPCQASLG